jgi:hypothetical protein
MLSKRKLKLNSRHFFKKDLWLTNNHILQLGIGHPYGVGGFDPALEGHAFPIDLKDEFKFIKHFIHNC